MRCRFGLALSSSNFLGYIDTALSLIPKRKEADGIFKNWKMEALFPLLGPHMSSPAPSSQPRSAQITTGQRHRSSQEKPRSSPPVPLRRYLQNPPGPSSLHSSYSTVLTTRA